MNEYDNYLKKTQKPSSLDRATINKLDELLGILVKLEQKETTVEGPTVVVTEKKLDDTAIIKAIEDNKSEVVIEKFNDAALIKAIKDNKPQITIEKTDLSSLLKELLSLKKIFSSLAIPQIPLNKGNDPKTANPSVYIPVRLTDGDKFYKAIEHAIASMGGSGNSSSVGNTVINGQKLIVSNNVPIQVGSGKIMNGVEISALSANTASVYIGDASVTSSNGFELQAGQTASLAINDLAKLYVTGTASDGICFLTTN